MAQTPLVIPNGFGQAALHWSVDGLPREITCTFGYANPTSNTAANNANNLWTLWNAAGGPCDEPNMSTIFRFTGVSVSQNDGGVQNVAEHNQVAVGSMPLTGKSVLLSTSLLIQKRTALSGRNHRGRFFFPFMVMGEDFIDHLGNIETATALPLLREVFSNGHTLSLMTDIDVPMVILHHDNTAPDPVTALVVSGKVANQSRRLR